MSLLSWFRNCRKYLPFVVGSSLTASAAYAVTLPESSPGSEVERSPDEVPELIENGTITMPEHLTQQGSKFYYNPRREFSFYRSLLRVLDEDDAITLKDVEALEFVLSRTIAEIDEKSTASSDNTLAWAQYNTYVTSRRNNPQKLRKYIQACNYWQELPEKIWHPGINVIDRLRTRSTATNLEALFKHDSAYVDVDKPDANFQYSGKWWLGLLLGLVAPALTSYVSTRIRGKEFEGHNWIYAVMNPLVGCVVTDGLHPLAYPARLIAVPLAIETGRYILSRKKKKVEAGRYTPYRRKEEKVETPMEDVQAEEPKEEEEALPPKKVKLADPWEVDIPEIEDSRR